MIKNKDLYSFPESGDNLENESNETESAPGEIEAEAEPYFPYKFISHIITAAVCLILTLIISKTRSPWADWTRSRLHTAINATSQSTFGYLSDSPFFRSLIMNGSRLIRLEEITRLSARKFHFGEPSPPPVFNNAVWPVEGNISRAFGWQEDNVSHIRQFNPGVEFVTGKNAYVSAIAAGEVIAVKSNQTGSGEIVIDHGNGWNSVYRSIANIKVDSGRMVKTGAIIAQTLADKVILELRHDRRPVDPFTVIGN